MTMLTRLLLLNILVIVGVTAQAPYLEILGVAQDAGFPQMQCKKSCCQDAWDDVNSEIMVSCLAIVFPQQETYYLIDATPDLKHQMHRLESKTGFSLGGIFLTHAHIGHYTGLMDLGREAMGADEVPVYVMPRMKKFLEENGPWSQLVKLKNVALIQMENEFAVQIQGIQITPVRVPHRDEYSETVGYKIEGSEASAWYIPDIDKWYLWDRQLTDELSHNYLLVDGTFYQNGEIWGRDMSEIPHPFIAETMDLLDGYSEEIKSKVIFTHLNHTNPALWDNEVRQKIEENGFRVAFQGMKLQL